MLYKLGHSSACYTTIDYIALDLIQTYIVQQKPASSSQLRVLDKYSLSCFLATFPIRKFYEDKGHCRWQ